MADFVVGIDLGTTNSLVGAVVDGRVRLFTDPQGADLFPSAVSGDGGSGVLVGRAARNRRLLDPAGTVLSIKRMMGKDVRVQVGNAELSPSQVSALILGALLDRVVAHGFERPSRAVITVPAYFNDAQRQATRDAGEIAGLTVERLVNEPTAAALTYQTGVEERVLVYDLGGGTFDVSILERDQGFLEVKASRGDTQLGGDDVDRALTERVLARLEGRKMIEGDRRAHARLVDAVERAKMALSDRSEVRLFDPFLAGSDAAPIHLDHMLTQDDVAAVARPLIERTLRCIDEALRDAQMDSTDLDRILLVGGSSKMPLVRAMVSEHLGRPAQTDLEADRAVAMGASLLAGRLSGEEVREVLVDITPHTLSVGTLDRPSGLFGFTGEDNLRAEPIIPRDTVLPVARTTTLFTMRENQDAVVLPIVQGEADLVADNTPLGHVEIWDLPASPAHSPVEVEFKLDISGVLHVSAVHVPSARAASITIANSPYQLTAQKRDAARKQIERLRKATSVEDSALTESDAQLARAMLTRAARALDGKVGDDDVRERVRRAEGTLRVAVDAMDPVAMALMDSLSDALLDLA